MSPAQEAVAGLDGALQALMVHAFNLSTFTEGDEAEEISTAAAIAIVDFVGHNAALMERVRTFTFSSGLTPYPGLKKIVLRAMASTLCQSTASMLSTNGPWQFHAVVRRGAWTSGTAGGGVGSVRFFDNPQYILRVPRAARATDETWGAEVFLHDEN